MNSFSHRARDVLHQWFSIEWVFSRLLAVLIATALVQLLLGRFEVTPSDGQAHKPCSLGLDNYRLIHERVIDIGLENASGLTFNPLTNTLFMVLNRPETVVELSLYGDRLRQIRLNGFDDTEAITWLKENRYAIAEEALREISIIEIGPDTLAIDKQPGNSYALPDKRRNNKGIEGMTFDRHSHQLYVNLERYPVQMFRLQLSGSSISPALMPLIPRHAHSVQMQDFSGLQYLEQNVNLLILSHNSSRLVESIMDGRKISELALYQPSSGAKEPVLQAEGVTIDDSGRIYVVSEPKLFYVYQSPGGNLVHDSMLAIH